MLPSRVFASIALIALFLFCGLSACWGTVYVNWSSPSDGPGNDWAHAFHTVAAGLNAASSGSVWVARGTYAERITLKPGVELYGGFVGSETTLAQRPAFLRSAPDANETILDGQQGGAVVTSPSGITSTTRIDGFTIRNGSGALAVYYYYGGGIYCDGSSPTIEKCTITGNNARLGGGIYTSGSWGTANIANCVVKGNTAAEAGGGIYGANAHYAITRCVIRDNYSSGSGGGIGGDTNTGFGVTSCTIIGNSAIGHGGGIYAPGGGGYVSNVIASNSAFDGGGIFGSGLYLGVRSNTIVGNSASEGGGIYYVDGIYSSPSFAGNIVAFNSSGLYCIAYSPIFSNNDVFGNAAYDYGAVSNQTGSTGNISVDPQLASLSYGNLRLQPGSPCIDADNAYSSSSDFDADGQPRRRGAAMDSGAYESDGTTWTVSPVVVRVALDGNDANDGSSWPLAKRTIQAAIYAASAVGGEVWVKAGFYRECISLQPYCYVYGGFAGSETSRDDRNWRANVTTLDGLNLGEGVVLAKQVGYRLGRIDGFTLQHGSGGHANYYTATGGGVFCLASPVICNNRMTQNWTTQGGGIGCYGSSPLIINNLIDNNSAASYGGGIYCLYSSATITNNTITGNQCYNGGGIFVSYCSPTITNNIVAFNPTGLWTDDPAHAAPVLRYNDVYGNQFPGQPLIDYYQITDPTGANGNIKQDPLFALKESCDYHLTSGSPCRNAGNPGGSYTGQFDMDRDPRVMETAVDIGADEFDNTRTAMPAFAPGEGTYNAALDVVVTCPTPGATIHYTTDGSAPTSSSPTVAPGGTVAISQVTTLKAMASASGLQSSYTATALYTMKVAAPTFDPYGGPYLSAPQPVTVTCATPSVTIHYTTNGTIPTTSDPIVASGSSVLVDRNMDLMVKAWKSGWVESDPMDSWYQFLTPAVTFSVPGGAYPAPQTVVMDCAAPDAIIYYTMDGTYPSESSPHMAPGGSVVVARTLTLSAVAQVTGWYGQYVSAEYSIPAIYRVKPDGNDSNDGSSWALAKRTIQGALDATHPNDEIWVAAGTYPECITMKAAIAVYGGFAGTETARSQRDWVANVAIIDGSGQGPVISALSFTQACVIDGFTIQNGNSSNGGGVYCFDAAITIANNRIINNSSSQCGAGMMTVRGTVSIVNNVIAHNTVVGLGQSAYGAGIYSFAGTPVIANNLITDNSVTGNYAFGAGMMCDSGSPIITGNTIAKNFVSGTSMNEGGGIWCMNSSPTIADNIIVFNTSGIFRNASSTSGTVTMHYNDVFGNTLGDYVGVADPTGSNGNRKQDPLFVLSSAGNYHLASGSPCIGVGDNSAAGIPALDIDGEARIAGGTVDLGADEYWPALTTLVSTKLSVDNKRTNIASGVVSKIFPDYFYVEAADRSCGILVRKPGHTLTVGKTAHIDGIVKTNADGERFIGASVAADVGVGSVMPLGTTNKALGGAGWQYDSVTGAGQQGIFGASGLSNIGLRVKAWGKVSQIDPAGLYYYIDDGSGIIDGTQTAGVGNIGIRVAADGGSLAPGQVAVVDGVSSCFRSVDGKLRRILRP